MSVRRERSDFCVQVDPPAKCGVQTSGRRHGRAPPRSTPATALGSHRWGSLSRHRGHAPVFSSRAHPPACSLRPYAGSAVGIRRKPGGRRSRPRPHRALLDLIDKPHARKGAWLCDRLETGGVARRRQMTWRTSAVAADAPASFSSPGQSPVRPWCQRSDVRRLGRWRHRGRLPAFGCDPACRIRRAAAQVPFLPALRRSPFARIACHVALRPRT